MNVEVLARVRPPKRGEHLSLNLSGTRVQAGDGTGHIFSAVYKSEALTYDIFRDAFSPLVELFIAGYNVCVLVFGETGSGKSYSVAGEKTSKAGLVPLTINAVFTRIKNERSARKDVRVQRSDLNDGVVFVQFYEVCNEKVRDLLVLPHEGRHCINRTGLLNALYLSSMTFCRCFTTFYLRSGEGRGVWYVEIWRAAGSSVYSVLMLVECSQCIVHMHVNLTTSIICQNNEWHNIPTLHTNVNY